MDIEHWRGLIDATDLKILDLINKRAEYSIKIGGIKEKENLPIYSPQREAWIIERLIAENSGPLTAEGVRRIFERVIDECRRIEKETCKNREKE